MKEILENVRKKRPLIHNITNYVTVNDCANITLACGASPVMTADINEVEEITRVSDGLNINIGTLNINSVEAMIAAGKCAGKENHPILFDPVGAGATAYRTKMSKKILEEVKVSVIRGNISEIRALALGENKTVGVDASMEDELNEKNEEKIIEFVKKFAADTNTTVIASGKTDIVTDGKKTYLVHNGDEMMSRITGSGCMLSAMTAAFISANKDNILDAALTSVCVMGIAGETAKRRMKDEDGNVSYRNYLIDAVCNMTKEQLEREAKYESR